MTSHTPQNLVRDIVAFVDANPGYKVWVRLPDRFLETIAEADADAVLDLAFRLWTTRRQRLMWAAITALRHHPAALQRVRWRELERLGSSMGDWGAVDAFASLAGPAWRDGRISDSRIRIWARSPNRWFRRAALVCTVFLNRKSVGGYGDPRRTLAVCRILLPDRDDMVVKAMSWALRDLAKPCPDEVRRFFAAHEDRLAARVLREVRNKLTTGVKNPRRGVKAIPSQRPKTSRGRR